MSPSIHLSPSFEKTHQIRVNNEHNHTGHTLLFVSIHFLDTVPIGRMAIFAESFFLFYNKNKGINMRFLILVQYHSIQIGISLYHDR